jgi:SAM-dependent methyltransferase
MKATGENSTEISNPYAAYPGDAFSRLDDSDDGEFYAKDRFVNHLDTVALATVEKIIGQLIVGENPVVLDLMAGWNSHLPNTLKPLKITGLGLNENELARNETLSEAVLHDLNKDPNLPFPKNTFDAVINTVSVDYLVKPFEVFEDVGRVLKPGGIFLVIFSNRMFPNKATKIWRTSSEQERVLLVEDFFAGTHGFGKPEVFISKGRPRPLDDKYAHLGIPSDPVYAVYAVKAEAAEGKRTMPHRQLSLVETPDERTIERRTAEVKETLQCPHCGTKMRKWKVPVSPFSTWDTEFMYVCFNDECPYLLRGWEVMSGQGNRGLSYRLMFDPLRGVCMPVPVPHIAALKDGIID